MSFLAYIPWRRGVVAWLSAFCGQVREDKGSRKGAENKQKNGFSIKIFAVGSMAGCDASPQKAPNSVRCFQ